MAVSELLRLVVDADTRGAVTGIQQVGHTATRQLSRAEKSIDRFGSRLTSIGAGMVGLGSVALVGLGAAAMASEEANLATVKLENTLANMPQLAGENSEQFIELADAIQDKTAADGDQIVAAEAMLGTFRLTADEIKKITPLVVDYARKFDVDLVSAATQVGKALDGNVGALKRNGVSIDEVLFKTDRYAAVQQALSEQVGGFAQAEGATFAGSLQRMKNELGDLAEGVGTGAVDAFTSMFGVVDGLTDRLNSLSPAAQNTIGKFATFGSVGLIAAGGLSFMIGQAIKMRDHFKMAADGVGSLITRLRGMSGAQLAFTGFAAAVTAGAVALDQYNRSEKASNTRRLTDEFLAAGESAAEMSDVFRSAVKHGPAEVIGVFEELATTNRAAAERFLETAEAAGVSSGVLSQMRDALETTSAASAQTSEDTAGLAGAMDEAGAETEEATTALQRYADQLRSQFDPLFGMISAQNALRDAQVNVEEAQTALNEALASGDPAAIAEAQRTYNDALAGSSEALVGAQSAQAALNDAVNAGDVELGDAQDALYRWAISAGFTTEQAMLMAGQLGNATTKAQELDRQNVNVPLAATDNATPTIRSVEGALDRLPSSKDVSIRVHATGLSAINLIENKLLGFATGGTVPGPRGKPRLVVAHGGETVVPTHDQAAMRQFAPAGLPAAGIGGGGGGTVVVNNVVHLNGPIGSEAEATRWLAKAMRTAGESGRPITVRGRRLA